jgi:hypothetical protein
VAFIVGGLALFVALCGLWLASYGLRKIDTQLNEFLTGPLQQIRLSVMEVAHKVSAINGEFETFKRQSKDALTNMHRDDETLKNSLAQTNRILAEMAEKIQQCQNQIAQIQPRGAHGHARPQPVDPPSATAR